MLFIENKNIKYRSQKPFVMLSGVEAMIVHHTPFDFAQGDDPVARSFALPILNS